MIKNKKEQQLTQYILQGGVRWYANCGFPFRSSVSFGQERSPKSALHLHKPLYMNGTCLDLNDEAFSGKGRKRERTLCR